MFAAIGKLPSEKRTQAKLLITLSGKKDIFTAVMVITK